MAIGDIIFKLMGQKDPREALLAAVAGGGTQATPPAAGATSAQAGTGGATAAPQPTAYQSPPQLIELYQKMMDRQEKNRRIDRGIGMIGASLAQEQNRPGIMAAFSGGGGGDSDPTTMLNNIMAFNQNQTALNQKAAQRAAVPAIAAKYGLDVATAQYLFDTGKLDSVIAEAEKPNKEVIQNEDGTHTIVDRTDGSLSDPFGVPKKREMEIVEGNNGEKFAVYKDTKERVGAAPIVEGQRKTEFIEDPTTGGKINVYSDTKEPVGAGDIRGAGNTDDEKKYHAAMRGLPAGEQVPFNEWLLQQKRAGATQVNVGPTGIDYGDPPKDTAWQRDGEGKIVLDERGVPIALPVKGGTVYAENEAEVKRGQDTQKAKEAVADVVTEDIDRLVKIIDGTKDNTVFTATGLPAAIGQYVPGTPAFNAKALADTVRANVGFDKLQAMRAASPTGAALGPVSDFENKLLQSTIGNLELAQDRDQVLFNLARVKRIYSAIMTTGIKTPEEADKLMQDNATTPSIDDLVKMYKGK